MTAPYEMIPAGWYCVAFSKELRRGQVRTCNYFGHELVLYRTDGGEAHLSNAHCPHLGAHLGHGGKVEGEILRCPFHGFCFDGEGACVSTPYGHKPPKAARLRKWIVREHGDLILAWYHPQGEAPTWEVPVQTDLNGLSRMQTKAYQIRSHPQETSENSSDFGHFTVVHSFLGGGGILEPIKTDGPRLTISYGVRRSLDLIGLPRVGVELRFDVMVHGLGYSMVDAVLPRFNLRMRHYVLSTPVDESHVHMRIASRAAKSRVPGLTSLLREVVFAGLRVEVEQDIPIWEHKRYVDPPALAKGDGPIGRYRRWCRQFYPTGETNELTLHPGGAKKTG